MAGGGVPVHRHAQPTLLARHLCIQDESLLLSVRLSCWNTSLHESRAPLSLLSHHPDVSPNSQALHKLLSRKGRFVTAVPFSCLPANAGRRSSRGAKPVVVQPCRGRPGHALLLPAGQKHLQPGVRWRHRRDHALPEAGVGLLQPAPLRLPAFLWGLRKEGGHSALCICGMGRVGGREMQEGREMGTYCICITDSLCYKAEANTAL